MIAWPRSARATAPQLARRPFDLLCLTMAVVLATHAVHVPWWLDVTLAIVLGLRWWQRDKYGGCAPAWLKLPLMALLLLAVIGTYGSLFGREPGSAFAVGLLVLKLLETESARDVRVGVSFGCFALMAALLFDQGLVLTVLVTLGLLPALATLRALEPARVSGSFVREFLPAAGLLVAAVPLALFAFVLVPRLSSPLWGAPNPAQARTGLSDRMSPGNFTELLTDDSPAMRVSFDGAPPTPQQRYFRGYVLTGYDGRSWFRSSKADAQPPAPLQASAVIRYRIDLEPSEQTMLPTLDMPLQAPAQGALGPNREVLAAKSVHDRLRYIATSALHYRLQPTLTDAERARALRLPRGFNPRTHQLARQWRARYRDDDAAIAQAALTRFHDGGFRYTLAPAPLGRDAMDDFLFDMREGFCEHYASAFTVLMRAAGVPARVVTGYQGGYWNALANYLLVRQSDAHAWGEIWLADRGWVRVDPTASVRPERVSEGAAAAAGDQLGWMHDSWLQGMRNHWDVVNQWWNTGVIGFDALRQRGLLKPFGLRDIQVGTLGLLLAIGSAVFVAIGLAWALLRRVRVDPAVAALRRLESKLAARGITRRRGEGPQHYLSRAGRTLPAQREQLAHLAQAYVQLRYASVQPAPELLKAFQRAVRNFRPARVVK